MIPEEMIIVIEAIQEFGFTVVVAGILLYDRIKSNRALTKTVENNSRILTRLEIRLKNLDKKRGK